MKVTRERILHFEKMARNVYRRAVVEKKKTGTFDKEYALNRTLNIIDRMNKLAVADSVKRESKAHCWKVYLDIQAMSHDNSIRDERQVAFKDVLLYIDDIWKLPKQSGLKSADARSGGLGYRSVNWNYIWTDKKGSVWGDQYWKPTSGKRNARGQLLDLADSDYWVFRDARRESGRDS